ncbi:hypothetical protein HDU96_002575 [Phlyctochytrium bullatum]|nr:hypothetical protein HDU96_002575 [Phlyctochytrium bullatum]
MDNKEGAGNLGNNSDVGEDDYDDDDEYEDIGDTEAARETIMDWALGAMYTKILYTLILAGPDTEIRRALGQAREQLREDGLQGLEIRPFAFKYMRFRKLFAVLSDDGWTKCEMIITSSVAGCTISVRREAPTYKKEFHQAQTARGFS